MRLTTWFFTPPVGLADIVIHKEVTTDDRIDMRIDTLRLGVIYDYFERRLDQVELAVDVIGETQPLILLDIPDANGRKDGRGDIRRVFYVGQQVTLKVPPTYGAWRFRQWLDKSGNPLTPPVTEPQLMLQMDGNRSVRAQYER